VIIVERFRKTHDRELAWISGAQQGDLDRELETPFMPGRKFSLAQAVIQVCLHSQGHRAQCAGRLRALGGVPPAMDFMLWLQERPAGGVGVIVGVGEACLAPTRVSRGSNFRFGWETGGPPGLTFR